jgi:hypothetical protein
MIGLAPAAYVMCAAASAIAAFLLLRSFRATHTKLLLWSGLCFVFLAAENFMIFVDLVLTGPTLDLRLYRLGLGLAGFVCLLFGLIWEAPR